MFTVTADRVSLPNGRETTLDIIRHRGSVVLIPMPDTGARRPHPAVSVHAGPVDLGAAGRSLDPGETPPAAARECEEEIGLVPTGGSNSWGRGIRRPGFVTEVMNFYKLTGLRAPDPDGPPAHKDEDEDIRAEVFTLDEARAMVKRGEVVDLKTAWGLTLV